MEVSKIAVSNNTIAALIGQQVYLSNNNGASWMYASGGNFGINTLIFLDSTLFIGKYNGMFLSNNWGTSYSAINNGLPANCSVNVLQAIGTNIVASVRNNATSETDVYYTIDKGNSWNLSNGLQNLDVNCMANNGINLYAGTWDGLYVSYDKGANWSYLGFNNKTISVLGADGNRLFAGEGSSGGFLSISQDNGTTWTSAMNGLPQYLGSMVFVGTAVYIISYWNGIYVSNNNGGSWTFCGSGGFMNLSCIATNGSTVFVGSSDGFSNLGGIQNTGLHTYNLTIKSLVCNKDKMVAATGYLVHNSTDNGLHWNYFLRNMNCLIANDSLVIAADNGAIYLSRDFGANWEYRYSMPSGSDAVSAFAMKDTLVFAASKGNGFYSSSNSGIYWKQDTTAPALKNINALEFIDSLLFAASNSSGMLLSSDYGKNWKSVSIGLPDTSILSLARFENNLYAGTRNFGLYKSVDFGASWFPLNIGISNARILSIHTMGPNVLAGIAEHGLSISRDEGQTWRKENLGLMNYNITAITNNQTNVYLGSGGHIENGGGVWKRAILEMNLFPYVEAITYNKSPICAGDSVQAFVHVLGGTEPISYTWSNGNSGPVISLAPSVSANYTVSIIDAAAQALSTQVQLHVQPAIQTPVIHLYENTLFSNFATGNVWMLNGIPINAAIGASYSVNKTGNYSVQVVKDGCYSDTSNSIKITSLYKPLTFNEIEVYPNPTEAELTIRSPKKSIIRIFNSLGELTLESFAEEENTKLNLAAISCGFYFLYIETPAQVWTGKLVRR
ncbi:MAG: T9SS type A sorting domain-containing protein [Bacteroidetes bacterium]|nr:T9SS type A sorting domain-containing protein [Bacteroidota bacterium]